jgi:predicted GNAT family acetyltransferase
MSTPTDRPDTTVRDNLEQSRYDVFVEGELAGFAVYRLVPGHVVFVHTEIEDRYEGHGVGSVLASVALDDVRAQGKHVTPQCPFIAAYIRRHPEYLDLVDDANRDQFRSAT